MEFVKSESIQVERLPIAPHVKSENTIMNKPQTLAKVAKKIQLPIQIGPNVCAMQDTLDQTVEAAMLASRGNTKM